MIRLAEAARSAPAGTSIVVLATDPAARYDIAAWCRMRGHELHEMAEVGDLTEMPGTSETAGVTDLPEPSGTDIPADRHSPAYLRFVVRLAS